MSKTIVDFAPRLVTAVAAARYLGTSPATLKSLEIPRKVVKGQTMYDRLDLDRFVDNLPYEKEVPGNSCDALFG